MKTIVVTATVLIAIGSTLAIMNKPAKAAIMGGALRCPACGLTQKISAPAKF